MAFVMGHHLRTVQTIAETFAFGQPSRGALCLNVKGTDLKSSCKITVSQFQCPVVYTQHWSLWHMRAVACSLPRHLTFDQVKTRSTHHSLVDWQHLRCIFLHQTGGSSPADPTVLKPEKCSLGSCWKLQFSICCNVFSSAVTGRR